MNTNNQPNPSKFAAFGMLPKRETSSNMPYCHPSHPAPPMVAERAEQFIIIIVDHKYIFPPPETLAKCTQQQV